MSTKLTDTTTTDRAATRTPPRTAIVTGGAGGIGSAISRRLAEFGLGVVVADIDAEAAARTAAALPQVGEIKHQGFAGDLTDSAVNRELAAHTAATAPIGVIVNAVGISPKRNGHKIPFHDLTDAEWNRVMSVNVSGPFFLIREAYRYMPTDGSASIVNLLSITAKLGTGGPEESDSHPYLPSTVAYGASKAALQNLTASLSRELAPLRIRVNGVAPGFVRTPMMGDVPPEGRLLDQVPMKRFAEPEEIADTVAFLAGDHASYINGTSIDVNGGWLTC
ncbi:SDR family NAD(P)-dependent oxidoreductase [Streptomyces sp. NPDC056227]|uniref:SDR family NAD(P)-dependent oxidoreductase n=1 Tax=Streptomyces sp. NPDC056227 TaxID=3345753 RepID=UPI0035DD555B